MSLELLDVGTAETLAFFHSREGAVPPRLDLILEGRGAAFSRGDCNDDGITDIADAILLLNALFPGGGEPPALTCPDACDANDDENLNIADAVNLLNALFGDPTIPLPPPTDCGTDPAGGTLLGCPGFGSCP